MSQRTLIYRPPRISGHRQTPNASGRCRLGALVRSSLTLTKLFVSAKSEGQSERAKAIRRRKCASIRRGPARQGEKKKPPPPQQTKGRDFLLTSLITPRARREARPYLAPVYSGGRGGGRRKRFAIPKSTALLAFIYIYRLPLESPVSVGRARARAARLSFCGGASYVRRRGGRRKEDLPPFNL